MQCDCEHVEHETRHAAGSCPNRPIYRVVCYGQAQNLCGVCVLFLVNGPHRVIESYRMLTPEEVAQWQTPSKAEFGQVAPIPKLEGDKRP
jgi:hypothetical protein